jgi:GH15 family glucan-1,4-alpha-glucosidase
MDGPRKAPRYRPIGDYALIGDCRGAGLISCGGSLDWLCLPRFDSPTIFAALLDADKGGSFAVRPRGAFQVERRYVPSTNVLETVYHTPTGRLILRDCLTVMSEEDKRKEIVPQHEVIREVAVDEGEVEIEILYAPRPDYGQVIPRLEQRGRLGFWCEANGAALALYSEVPLQLDPGGHTARGQTLLQAGDRRALSLTLSEDAPAVIPPLGAFASARIDRSVAWWHSWSDRCTYRGPWRDEVLRSALTLKLLTYAPSGAVLAAPTTSLPESMGGVRNWDYRYCWLRDASFTLRSLLALGYREEAEAFMSWALHTTRITAPELQVVYDVFGESDLPERELSHLEGYAGSRPVRVGNGAADQLQLDVYGEVVDAAYRFAREGGTFDADTQRLLQGIGHTVCRRWREPDDGIWEARAGRMQHTHSKVLCWVALDSLIKMNAAGQLRGDVSELIQVREQIRAEVETHGYNESIQSYTRLLGGSNVDAALLVLPLYEYVSASHPRMLSTRSRIRELLGTDNLVFRYSEKTEDGLPPGEGAFGICSFWEVECMALAGDIPAAVSAFEKLLTYSNDLGLFGEEIDPATGAALGNFPQAFTHVGLINAALTLAERLGQYSAAEAPPSRDIAIEDVP